MRGWFLDYPIPVSIVATILVVIVAVLLHRVFQEKWATFGVSILMSVLVGLLLNHFLAVSRERDQRRWTLGQEHLVRLRPVLRADSEKLAEVAKRVRENGRATSMFADATATAVERRSLFISDEVLSDDIRNHYPKYSQSKADAWRDSEEQDAEFDTTVSLIMKRLSRPPTAEQQRGEVARALIIKCLDKGVGMTLNISGSGFSYQAPGHGWGGSGPVPDEIRAAYKAFEAFQPDAEVIAHCDALKKRAVRVSENATRLSVEARRLAEEPTLPGSCEYTRLRD